MEEIKINENIREGAKRAYETVAHGGLVLFPDGVGYGLVGHSDNSIRRIYELKKRPLTKPLTHYMQAVRIADILNISNVQKEIAQKIGSKIPCCFVAPYKDGEYFTNLGSLALKQSTLEGTVALFFDESNLFVKNILELSSQDNLALIVSSANISGEGNSYTYENVPSRIKVGVDLAFVDAQPCMYISQANGEKRLGSTILDLVSRKIIRIGVLSQEIEEILEEHLGKKNTKN